MNLEIKRQSLLKLLLIASIIYNSIYFIDNYFFINQYSQPAWITAPSIYHYLYGSLSQFSLKMHLFIWTDGLTGLAVLGFVLWSALILKEWHRKLRPHE